jgi:hypothetical protein
MQTLRWRRSGCGGLRSVAANCGSLRWIRRGCGGALYVAVDKLELRPMSLRCGGSRTVAVRLALCRNVGIRCGGDGDVAVEMRTLRWSPFSIPPGAALRWSGSGCGGGRDVAADLPEEMRQAPPSRPLKSDAGGGRGTYEGFERWRRCGDDPPSPWPSQVVVDGLGRLYGHVGGLARGGSYGGVETCFCEIPQPTAIATPCP